MSSPDASPSPRNRRPSSPTSPTPSASPSSSILNTQLIIAPSFWHGWIFLTTLLSGIATSFFIFCHTYQQVLTRVAYTAPLPFVYSFWISLSLVCMVAQCFGVVAIFVWGAETLRPSFSGRNLEAWGVWLITVAFVAAFAGEAFEESRRQRTLWI